MAGKSNTEFGRRVLLVDNEERFANQTAAALRERSYEVLMAHDGFEALQVLRGGLPDLLITELDLPGMSGFELLSVVRTRFPQIAVIAMSSEYTAIRMPIGVIADAFVAKGPNATFELLEAAFGLISESPLRSSKAKPDMATVWIPRSSTGYIILTCPECIRSFSITEPRLRTDTPSTEVCISCGATVPFSMSPGDAVHVPEKESAVERSHRRMMQTRAAIADSEETFASTQNILNRHNRKR